MRSTDAAANRNAGAERRHTVGCSMHLLRMPAGTHAPPGSRSPHSRAAAFTSASLRNVITATLLDRAYANTSSLTFGCSRSEMMRTSVPRVGRSNSVHLSVAGSYLAIWSVVHSDAQTL